MRMVSRRVRREDWSPGRERDFGELKSSPVLDEGPGAVLKRCPPVCSGVTPAPTTPGRTLDLFGR